MAKSTKPKSAKYELSLKVMGKVYTSSGDTLSEAITNLGATGSKGIGVLTIKHGDRVKDKILTKLLTDRLFNTHGLHQQIILKQVETIFN